MADENQILSQTSTFGTLLRAVRKEQGLSQGELSQRSHVSIRTIINIEGEKQTNQRGDVTIRLANALGQSPITWLQLTGHTKIDEEKIKKVLRDSDRFRFENEADPSEFFGTLKAQLRPDAPVLLCVAYTSIPRTINRPDILQLLVELVNKGLWIAMVFPYPKIEEIEIARRKHLNRLYRQVYDGMVILATSLMDKMSPDQRGHVGVFSPREESDKKHVRYIPPLAGLADYRPTLVKYFYTRASDKPKYEYELATWLTTSRDKRDRWLQVYPSDSDEPERYDRLLCWCDYFNDILINCKPESRGWKKSDFKETDWQLINLP